MVGKTPWHGSEFLSFLDFMLLLFNFSIHNFLKRLSSEIRHIFIVDFKTREI